MISVIRDHNIISISSILLPPVSPWDWGRRLDYNSALHSPYRGSPCSALPAVLFSPSQPSPGQLSGFNPRFTNHRVAPVSPVSPVPPFRQTFLPALSCLPSYIKISPSQWPGDDRDPLCVLSFIELELSARIRTGCWSGLIWSVWWVFISNLLS